MKKLILFAFFFVSIKLAVASPCQSHFDDEKNIESHCLLENKGFAIEMVKLKPICMEMEGAKKENCYLVRTCPKNTTDYPRTAPQILEKYLTDGTYCEKEKDEVILRHEKYEMQAVLKCEGNKVKHIELQLASQSKVCKFNFK